MRDYKTNENDRTYKALHTKQMKVVLALVIVLISLSVFVGISLSKQRVSNERIEMNVTHTNTNQESNQVITPVNNNQNVSVEPTVTPSEKNTILINETIQGSKASLTINLEVEPHNDEQYGIYDATPIDIDVDKCVEYIFPETSKDELSHAYDSEVTRNRYNVTDMNYRDTVLDFRNEDTLESIMYDPHNQSIMFNYLINKADVQCDPGGCGHLLRRDQEYILPDENLLKEATLMSEEFLTTILGDEFTENFVFAYSGLKKTTVDDYHTGAATQVYLTVFQRPIEGLPILFDRQETQTGYYMEPIIDELEVWVYDNKVLFSQGAIRHLEIQETSDIISPEQALGILKENVDVVDAKGSYDIETFDLMYYATFTDDADSSDIRGELMGAGYIKYIPVWVIASGERTKLLEGECDEYVMIIDAVTGEAIERRKDRR